VSTSVRAAGVARALVATAVCRHAWQLGKNEGLSPAVKQQISEVRKHALQSLQCEGADISTVSASAIAVSERLRQQKDAAERWQTIVDCGFEDLLRGRQGRGGCVHVQEATESVEAQPGEKSEKGKATQESAENAGLVAIAGEADDVRTDESREARRKVVVRLAGSSAT
jgi:hypothetical protein